MRVIIRNRAEVKLSTYEVYLSRYCRWLWLGTQSMSKIQKNVKMTMKSRGEECGMSGKRFRPESMSAKTKETGSSPYFSRLVYLPSSTFPVLELSRYSWLRSQNESSKLVSVLDCRVDQNFRISLSLCVLGPIMSLTRQFRILNLTSSVGASGICQGLLLALSTQRLKCLIQLERPAVVHHR